MQRLEEVTFFLSVPRAKKSDQKACQAFGRRCGYEGMCEYRGTGKTEDLP